MMMMMMMMIVGVDMEGLAQATLKDFQNRDSSKVPQNRLYKKPPIY
jgi:hypothetical protein